MRSALWLVIAVACRKDGVPHRDSRRPGPDTDGTGVPTGTGEDSSGAASESGHTDDTAPWHTGDTAPVHTGDTATTSVGCGGTVDWAVHLRSRAQDWLGEASLAPDGTFVIGGWAMREMVFGEGQPGETLFAPYCGGADAPYLARYRADGTLLWARRVADSCDYTRIEAVQVASDDTIFVGGTYFGETTFGAGTDRETAFPEPSGTSPFVARYTGQGDFLWAQRTDGFRHHAATWDLSVAADGARVYLTGEFSERLVFAPGTPEQIVLTTLPDSETSTDVWTAAYSGDGAFLWGKSAAAPVSEGVKREEGEAVAALEDGVVATAEATGQAIVFGLGEPGEITVAREPGAHAPWAVYGTDGAVRSARMTGGDHVKALVSHGEGLLAAGNLISTEGGRFGGGQPNEITLERSAYFLASYTPEGALNWVHAPGFGSGGYGTAVAAYGERVAVGGSYLGWPLWYEDHDVRVEPFDEVRDAFAALYTVDGGLLCAWGMGGEDEQDTRTVLVDHEGGVIVGGVFDIEITIGRGTPEEVTFAAENNSTDLFLMRIAP